MLVTTCITSVLLLRLPATLIMAVYDTEERNMGIQHRDNNMFQWSSHAVRELLRMDTGPDTHMQRVPTSSMQDLSAYTTMHVTVELYSNHKS